LSACGGVAVANPDSNLELSGIPSRVVVHQRSSPVVLVIDDNRDHVDLVRDQLGPQFCIVGATDGLDGYSLACAEPPGAIVLNVGMPVVDGWSVIRKLRSNPKTSEVPIMVVTGLDVEGVRPEAARFGVRALLGKPYDATDLRRAVQKAVTR
jgi:CheY-like chemotaxis protein